MAGRLSAWLWSLPVALYAYNVAEKSWKGPGATIYNIINPIGIYGGIAVAIGLSFSAWHLYKKLANLNAWQSGCEMSSLSFYIITDG